MDMRLLADQAKDVIDRSVNTNANIGVVLSGEGVKKTRADTLVFAKALKDYPERVVGVYNAGAEPEQIVEDAVFTAARR